MGIVVSIDGTITQPEGAKVSVFDRGFLYGDSVFETMRTYGGVPFALSDHLDRLERSAGLVYIPLPIGKPELRQEVEATVRAAGNRESFVRVMLTRGQGELGLDPSLADVPRRVIIVGPLNPPPPELYESGIGTVTFRTQRPNDSTVAEGAKIGNYLVAVLAVRAARAANAHEALILSADGGVVEGASSNVFGVDRGRLVTPPENAGILAGITRQRVLLLAREQGMDVVFEAPSVERLVGMDEVFISSSIRELLPVVRVDDRLVGSGRPGPITRRLHEAFAARVRLEMGL